MTIFRYLSILIAVFLSGVLEAKTTIKNGMLDLRSWSSSEEPIISLTGPWEMYWDELLDPQTYPQKKQSNPNFLAPHEEWHKTQINGLDMKRIGQATYILNIISDKDYLLTLKVPVLNSASRIWFNGEVKQKFGELSRQLSGEKPWIGISYLDLSIKAGENLLIVAVSNHSFWYGGASKAFTLGLPGSIQNERELAVLNDALVLGFILFMSLYHLIIWWLLPHSKSALWLGLFSLTITLRMLVLNEGQLLAKFLPEFAAVHHHFIEYLGTSLPGAFLLLFIRSVYPGECSKLFYTPTMALCFAWSLCILVLPQRWFPFFLEIFQWVILYFGGLCVYSNCLAVIRKREAAWILLLGITATVIAGANDVFYSRGEISTGFYMPLGIMVLLFSQSTILADIFARLFKRTEAAESAIRQLNTNLEQRIEERTQEINIILNHVRSGFVLLDHSGTIQAGFTRSCAGILGAEIHEQQKFEDYLQESPQMAQQFRMALGQIFEAQIPLDIALAQLPSRFPLGQKVISLEGAAVQQKDTQEVTRVLLTLTDATKLVEAEANLRHSATLIRILEDRDSFRVFLMDLEREIQAAQQALKVNDQKFARSIIHTIKGNSGTFQLQGLVELAHSIEDQTNITVDSLNDITNWIRKFLVEYGSILSIDPDRIDRSLYTVDDHELEKLGNAIASETPQFLPRFLSWEMQVKALPVHAYVAPLTDMVERVAALVEKDVRVILKGNVTRIPPLYAPVLSTLNHLLRNAIIHGIEPRNQRGHKPVIGSIVLNFYNNTNGILCLDVEDDGHGIDARQIRQKALSQKLIDPDMVLTDRELMQLIFSPSFSTQEEVDEQAGRGMGLAAVAKAVQDLGGTFSVDSILGQGTRFHIELPEPVNMQKLPRVG